MVAGVWGFEYNNLEFGGELDVAVTGVDGLEMPNVQEDVVSRSVAHGAFVRAEFLEHRRIRFRGFIIGADAVDFRDRLHVVKQAFHPRGDVLPLRFWEPEYPIRRVNCVPTRLNLPVTIDYSLGYTDWSGEFLAGDPRIYDDAEQTIVGAGVASNGGIFSTPVVIEISGATNPVIGNSTTGEQIAITGAIGTSTLVVDTLARTVKLNGVSRYDMYDLANSSWWELLPGNNTITYSGGGTMTLRWRSAWI